MHMLDPVHPARSAVEELLHLVQPGLRAGIVTGAVLLAEGLELAQQLALALGEAHGGLDHDVAEEVARRLAAHALDPLCLQPEGLAALGLGGHADLGRAVEGRDRDLAAERGGRERHRHLAMQVVVIALEYRVLLDVDLDVKVARRPAAHARLAFAGETHAITFVDAGGDFHRQRLLQLDPPGAGAGGAGVRNDAAAAMAARAGLRDGEGPLRHAHLAGAAAGRAGLGLAAGARAAAFARLARGHAGNADLGLEAVRRLLQRDLEVVAQVGAAEHGRASAAGAAAEDLAEDVAEDVAEAAHAGGARAGRMRIDAGVAELVVGRALAGVGENLVGLLRLLEVVLRLRVVRIAVRVPLHRQPAISLLEVLLRSVAVDA